MSIGENIKKARIDAGLSQKQLGECLGITAQSVAQWETGRREPKYQSIVKIADALNVPVSLLYGISENDPEKQEAIRAALTSSAKKNGQIDTEAFMVNLQDEYAKVNYGDLITLRRKTDELYKETLSDWSDDRLFSVLSGDFFELNRVGKIEAVKRVAELISIRRFCDYEDNNNSSDNK